MDAQESALRFMYFYDQYTEDNVLGDYLGNMDSALDEYVEKINRQTNFQNYISSYLQSLSDAFSLFGKYAFRKVYTEYENSRRNQVNKLLMMTICVLLAKYRGSYKKWYRAKKRLNSCTCKIDKKRSCFFNAITWSTNSKANMKYVFEKIKKDLFDYNLIENGQS